MKPGQFLRRLFSGPPEQRAASLLGVSPVYAGWQGPFSGTRYVDSTLAENLATVTACVSAIASAIASLPPLLYRSTGRGRTELIGPHPLSRVIRSPYGALTWPDWLEWLVSSVLLQGNGLAEIQSDAAGRVTALRPLPWQYVSPVLLPSGRLAFDVSIWPEPRRRLLEDEVLFLKDRSDDGYIGRSRISRAPDVIGNAASLQEFSRNAWENQAAPSGAIELTGSLNKDQFTALRARIEQTYSGPHNARRVMLLDNNAKWNSISVSPEDAEVLASRRFTIAELCRLFQVPPPIVQDYQFNTFTNAAQASLWFAQFSLLPWVKKIEAEFSRSVIVGNDVQLELDMSGLMRGDYAARWQAYGIARQNDILTTDEIREAEGYPPRGQAA